MSPSIVIFLQNSLIIDYKLGYVDLFSKEYCNIFPKVLSHGLAITWDNKITTSYGCLFDIYQVSSFQSDIQCDTVGPGLLFPLLP